MTDPFDLTRFVVAHESSYASALAELKRGRKTGHWIWFVFPQIAGLGSSAMSRHYAIRSVEEARAYLAHPVLGPRYRACVAALAPHTGVSAEGVFGAVDAAKLRSSLTLFAEAAPDEPLFADALTHWFGGERDRRTLALLGLARARG